ncbi:MAG: hypothetical protein ACPGTQ_04175 [Colwellia sp.]
MFNFNQSKSFIKAIYALFAAILLTACQSTSTPLEDTSYTNDMSDYQLMIELSNRPQTADQQLMLSIKAQRENNHGYYVAIKGPKTANGKQKVITDTNRSVINTGTILDNSNSVLIVPQ